MRKDLERIGAKPVFGCLVDTYQKELLRSIREAFPLDDFWGPQDQATTLTLKSFTLKELSKEEKTFHENKNIN